MSISSPSPYVPLGTANRTSWTRPSVFGVKEVTVADVHCPRWAACASCNAGGCHATAHRGGPASPPGPAGGDGIAPPYG